MKRAIQIATMDGYRLAVKPDPDGGYEWEVRFRKERIASGSVVSGMGDQSDEDEALRMGLGVIEKIAKDPQAFGVRRR